MIFRRHLGSRRKTRRRGAPAQQRRMPGPPCPRASHALAAASEGEADERALGARSPERLSKALAFLLRHGAAEKGVQVSKDGFASLEQVLNLFRNRVSRKDVEGVVASSFHSDGEPRFQMIADDASKSWWIRSMRHHSIPGVHASPVSDSDAFARTDRAAEADARTPQAETRALQAEAEAAAAEAEARALQAEARALQAEAAEAEARNQITEIMKQVEMLTHDLKAAQSKLRNIEDALRSSPAP